MIIAYHHIVAYFTFAWPPNASPRMLRLAVAAQRHIRPISVTKIIPAKIAGLKLSGRFPMDMRIPPLELKVLLESSPPKSRIVVRRLAVPTRESDHDKRRHVSCAPPNAELPV